MEIIEILEKTENRRKRVAAYCRVSTKHEEQESSLDTQIKYYDQYIKSNYMWEYADVYFDSKSGLRIDKRNGLQELLSKCDDGKVDIILVKSVTRFGRNLYEGILVLRHLKAIGVDVWFEQEGMKLLQMPSSVSYELMLIFAEAESEGKSQNIKFGIKHSFKTGKSKLYNRICYGYDNDELGNLVINEYEAKVVHDIFSWYLDGFSLSAISKELFEQGVRSPSGKEKWSSETISKLLSNEKLTGSVIGQKTFVKDFRTGIQVKNDGELERYYIKSHHIPIISVDCFQKVQLEKERRTNVSVDSQGDRTRRSTRYSNEVLSGKMVCGECGSNYRRITRRKGEVVWRCANRVEHGSRICKGSITVSDIEIKHKVADAFLLYEFDEDVFRKYIKQIIISNNISISIKSFNENDMFKLRELQMKGAAMEGDRKALNTLYEETYEKIKSFYCGDLVNHQRERSRITKKQIKVPKEEQFIHRDAVPAIIPREIWDKVQEIIRINSEGKVKSQNNQPCHRYASLLKCGDCGCSFVAKVRKTKGNPDRVEYVCNGYHRYSEVNCTSHRIREEMLDKIVQAELAGIRLVFDDLWENVEADVKKWAAGKSTTEKRLENLKESISDTELEIQKILMERIEDKQNADMYDKMIEARRNDIDNFKKEVYEIENLDKTIKERKSTLKHSIELLDDIIAENNISNANLHLMFDKIIIEETDEGLNLDLRLKSPFISKAKESLLKKYMIVDNEVLQEGA